MWLDLAKALCLVLVIEGIMPFVAPARWRSLVQMMAQIDDRTMRIVGLVSMVVGAGLLFLIK
jgi:uncharacterized protein